MKPGNLSKGLFNLFIFLLVVPPSHWWHPVTWPAEGHGSGTERNKERVWFHLFRLNTGSLSAQTGMSRHDVTEWRIALIFEETID